MKFDLFQLKNVQKKFGAAVKKQGRSGYPKQTFFRPNEKDAKIHCISPHTMPGSSGGTQGTRVPSWPARALFIVVPINFRSLRSHLQHNNNKYYAI